MHDSAPAQTLRGIRKLLHDAVYDPMRGFTPDTALDRLRPLLPPGLSLTHTTLTKALMAAPDTTVATAWRTFERRYPSPHGDLLALARLVAP